MKHIIVLRAVAFVGVLGSLIPATARLNQTTFEVARTVVDSPSDVSTSEKSPPITPHIAAKATNQELAKTNTPSPSPVVAVAEIVSALDRSFSEQRPDVEWSSYAEERVKALFRPLMSGDTTLMSLTCRTTLCRVEFSHASDTGFHNFLNLLKTSGVMARWKGQLVGGRVGIDGRGRVRSVFYLAKEGFGLPIGSLGDSVRTDGQSSMKPNANPDH